MADSIDLTGLYDFTVNDLTVDQVLADALANLQANMPDFVPREGTTEMLLLEALALEVSELSYIINRIPPGIVEAWLKLIGVTKDKGAFPTTSITFTMADDFGYTVEAATEFYVTSVIGTKVYFTTDTTLVIDSGDASGTVAATGRNRTSEGNSIAAGSPVVLSDAIPYLQSAALATDVVDGRDPETSEEFVDRGSVRFARLSDTLVIPRHFEAFALETAGITRAKALDNYDSASDTGGDGPVGSDPGFIAVAVYGENGTLSTEEKNSLKNAMQDVASSNLTITIIDPTLNDVDVTCTVVSETGFTAETVIANVTVALNNYLSAQTWDWSAEVPFLQLVKIIGAADGVSYVDSISTPSADVPLTGVAPLAVLGDFNITVI